MQLDTRGYNHDWRLNMCTAYGVYKCVSMFIMILKIYSVEYFFICEDSMYLYVNKNRYQTVLLSS